MRKILIVMSCAFGLFVGSRAEAQQTVTILWTSKQPQSAPITVDQNTPVRITVTGINDALYSYEGYVTSAPTPPPHIDFLSVGPGAAPPPAGCDDAIKALEAIVPDMSSWQLNAWVDSKGNDLTGSSPNSVSLETTTAFYASHISAKFAQVSQAQAHTCNLDSQWIKISLFTQEWAQRLSRPHLYTFDTTLAPFNDYTIHLIEYASDSTHSKKMTNACSQNGQASECTIKYQPQTNLLSASGGFLFSQLQSRTYSRANVPGMTDAVLQTNGTGRVNSLLTTLVNVKLPCFWSPHIKIPPCSSNPDNWGWMLSVGPALQLSGSDQTTRVGLFTGVSVHFWKYMYLTPGFHIGQFADFPAGFTHNGQGIPASFTGALTPQTRTTARFAIAITFKGFNIPTGTTKSSGQATTQNNTK